MPFRTKMQLLVMLLTLLVSIMPVSAGNGAVGVKSGDWAKYGEISLNWVSFSSESTPQYVVDWNSTEWIEIEVQSVYGTNITAVQTNHLKNGTENTETHTWNMTDNTRFLPPPLYTPDIFVIEANLSKGDPINIESLTLTDTVSRKYAGRTREVNQMNTTFWQGMHVGVTVNAYWNKTTGILCEHNETRINPLPGHACRLTTTMKIIETNLWQPTPFWTEPLFWVIIDVIIVVVTASGILIWQRRKRYAPPIPAYKMSTLVCVCLSVFVCLFCVCLSVSVCLSV